MILQPVQEKKILIGAVKLNQFLLIPPHNQTNQRPAINLQVKLHPQLVEGAARKASVEK